MDDLKKIKRYIAIGGAFAIIMFVSVVGSHFWEKKHQFAGVIEKLSYNEKKKVKVIVDGESYGLGTSGDFNYKMEIGDSLIKQKDSMNYKLIKIKTGEVIIGKSWN